VQLVRFGICLLVVGAILSACSRTPSPEYLAAVKEIQNRIDDFHGAQSTTKDIPQRLAKLIEDNPRQPHAYAEAAHFLIFVGSPNGWPGRSAKSAEAAESLLDDAQKADPSYCATYWLRAQLFVALEQADHALSAISTATDHRCDDPWLHVTHGRALSAKMEIDAAENEFRKVLDGGPGGTSHSRSAYAGAAYDYGVLLYRTGHHDELQQHLSSWEASGLVFDPWAQINLAYLFDLIGKFDHAQIAAQSALTVLELPAARNAMGLALYGQAWTHEAAGDKDGSAAKLTTQAQNYLRDDSLALDVLTGAACCVSDAWKIVLEKHAKLHPERVAPGGAH